MTSLGMNNLCALELDPVSFVSLAGELGCQEVSVFVVPMGAFGESPVVTRDNVAAVRERLAATGLRMANVEAFFIAPGADVGAFRPALECGAELGARGATVLVFDTDEARAIDNLTRFCELAAELKLRVGLEFMPLTPAWNTLQGAVELVRKVGAPNLGVTVDLLHLTRSGGTPADVAAVPPGLIAHAQVCDGADLRITSDYAEEATFKRLAPGDGQFPVQAFLKALPAGVPLEIEVPQPAPPPARERLAHILAATRRQMALAGLG